MSLWSFSVKRWQFTLVVFAMLVATGLWALSSIPRAEDPSLKFPGSLVLVQYPGADPEDVERLVVDPIEDALSELEDIKRLNSSALDGLALVEIEFTYGTDPDRKYDEVVREVNVVRSALPADVFSVEIRQFTPGTVNIVQLALLSETADWRELSKQAENLEELIETAPGVRRAETWAYPAPEVRVSIDLERLEAARVTLGQVIAAVQGENASIPGGAVDVGLRRYNLKTSGSYESLDEVRRHGGRARRVAHGTRAGHRGSRLGTQQHATSAATTASAPCSSLRTRRTAKHFRRAERDLRR